MLVKEMEKEREESESLLKSQAETSVKKCQELRQKIISLEEDKEKEKEVSMHI